MLRKSALTSHCTRYRTTFWPPFDAGGAQATLKREGSSAYSSATKGAEGASTGAMAPVTRGPVVASMLASAILSPYQASEPSPDPSMPGPV